MKRLIVFILMANLFSQDLEDLDFGTDSTFEILTWNIEWFPKNGQATVGYVTEIIEALDVDVLAIQEVDNTNMLVILTKEATEGLVKDNVIQDEALSSDLEKKDLLKRKNITFRLSL